MFSSCLCHINRKNIKMVTWFSTKFTLIISQYMSLSHICMSLRLSVTSNCCTAGIVCMFICLYMQPRLWTRTIYIIPRHTYYWLISATFRQYNLRILLSSVTDQPAVILTSHIHDTWWRRWYICISLTNKWLISEYIYMAWTWPIINSVLLTEVISVVPTTIEHHELQLGIKLNWCCIKVAVVVLVERD